MFEVRGLVYMKDRTVKVHQFDSKSSICAEDEYNS